MTLIQESKDETFQIIKKTEGALFAALNNDRKLTMLEVEKRLTKIEEKLTYSIDSVKSSLFSLFSEGPMAQEAHQNSAGAI